jgi:hypothetical protein
VTDSNHPVQGIPGASKEGPGETVSRFRKISTERSRGCKLRTGILTRGTGVLLAGAVRDASWLRVQTSMGAAGDLLRLSANAGQRQKTTTVS